jgi:hypothetical protein
MSGRSQTLPWWLGGGGVKTTKNKINCPDLNSSLSFWGFWERWARNSDTHPSCTGAHVRCAPSKRHLNYYAATYWFFPRSSLLSLCEMRSLKRQASLLPRVIWPSGPPPRPIQHNFSYAEIAQRSDLPPPPILRKKAGRLTFMGRGGFSSTWTYTIDQSCSNQWSVYS